MSATSRRLSKCNASARPPPTRSGTPELRPRDRYIPRSGRAGGDRRAAFPHVGTLAYHEMPLLTFDALGIELPVDGAKTVLEAALEELVEIRHNCGGLGMCTTCRIQIVAGAEALDPPNEAELHRLGAHRLERGWRLACQTVLRDDLTIRLPRYA